MKIIAIQFTGSVLYLTPVRMGARPIFGAPRSFLFPEELCDGPLKQPRAFADFVRACVRQPGLYTRNVVLCVEDDNLVIKEYEHPPAKKKFFASFAKLEAESVLQDDVNGYLVRNYEYGHQNAQSEKLVAALFALKKDLAVELKRAFSKNGIRLLKIVPPVAGLLHAAKSALAQAGKTVAHISVGRDYTRLLIFSDGAPVFQHSYASIFDEVAALLAKERGLSQEEAVEKIFHDGVAPDSVMATGIDRQIRALLDASTGEVVRNIRLVLSSERLEMDKIVLSGDVATLPGFLEYCEELGLGVPLETVDACCAASGCLPILTPGTAETHQPGSFFMLNGLFTAHGDEEVNLMPGGSSAGGRALKATLFTVVAAAAVFVMCLKPAFYFTAQHQRELDKAALADPRYTEVQLMMNRADSMNDQIKSIASDKAGLPYGQSGTQEVLGEVLSQITSVVLRVNTCNINNENGSVSLNFTTKTFEDYIVLKDQISETDYFEISIPFTASVSDETDTCTCSVTLRVKNFTPFQPGISAGKKGGAEE